jgi:hypothetical protein
MSEILNETNATNATNPVRPVRPVAQDLFDSLMLDVWPRPAAILDFGIDSQEHYAALQRSVKRNGVTAAQLDWALGNGDRLTKLTGIKFSTPYDDMGQEDDGETMPEGDEDDDEDFED